jgi:hypothetical protein
MGYVLNVKSVNKQHLVLRTDRLCKVDVLYTVEYFIVK